LERSAAIVVGQSSRGNVADDLVASSEDEPSAVLVTRDLYGIESPLRAHFDGALNAVYSDAREHPLLRLGHTDFPRFHVAFTQRDRIERAGRTEPGRRRRLRKSTSDPGGAEVLHAGQEAFALELEARLDEQLLREGVTDLHARTFRLGSLGELLRSEDGGAADAVPPRF
jgi:hypothetical protein